MIQSDYVPGLELDHVSVTVRPSVELSGVAAVTRSFSLVPGASASGSVEASLPISFGVAPPAGDASKAVDIEVEARGPNDNLLVRMRARVGFVAHEAHVLELLLTRQCAPKFLGCENDGKTCSEGACAAVEVDVRDLPRAKPGEQPVPWSPETCTDVNCSDAMVAMEASVPMDSSPLLDASTMDGSTPPADGSTLTEASVADGAIPLSDSGVDDGGADGDAGPACGPDGFWRDVGRPLAHSAESVLCPTVAESKFWWPLPDTLEETTQRQLEDIQFHLDAKIDVIGFNVLPSGGELLLTNAAAEYVNGPKLAVALGHNGLLQANQPLRIVLSDVALEQQTEVASALLDALLAFHPSITAGPGYAHGCRPVYLISNNARTFATLKLAQSQLSQARYAVLRGHVHFGARITDEHLYEARLAIEEAAKASFKLVEIDAPRRNMPPLLALARSKGLGVFFTDGEGSGMTSILCGISDGTSQKHMRQNAHEDVVRSRLLIDLDMTKTEPGATQNPYGTREGLMSLPLAAADSPTLQSGSNTSTLVGPYLHFDAASKQALTLADVKISASSQPGKRSRRKPSQCRAAAGRRGPVPKT